MSPLDNLRVKIFADGADFDGILKLYANPVVKGFTTNPTLMRKAGISDYETFGRKVLTAVPDRPVSLEVFADDLPTMLAQAKAIASWGSNVNVKVPVTNTKGEFTGPILRELSGMGITLNVTAIMTEAQVAKVASCLDPRTPAIVSVFAGRIADTGIDPVPVMTRCLNLLSELPRAELLWASPRELLNIFHADEIGCHIITVTNDVLSKLALVGKNLDEYSLETVKMFYTDASSAGYSVVTAS
jgi:transaldolase